jgi:hypothetical protein
LFHSLPNQVHLLTQQVEELRPVKRRARHALAAVKLIIVSHRPKGGSTMEPRKDQEDRFQIELLEERIAPTGNANGQLSYEGQPGNHGNGLLGYEGQRGNQGG